MKNIITKYTLALVALVALSLGSAVTARADAVVTGGCSTEGTTNCTKTLTLSTSGLLTITITNTTTGPGATGQFILADGFNLSSGIGFAANPMFTTTNANFELFTTGGPFNFPNSEGAGSANFLISAQGNTGTGGGSPSTGIAGGCTAAQLAAGGCRATFSLQLTGVTAANEAAVAAFIFDSELIRARGELGSDTDTTVRGTTPPTAVPEPATMILLGTGLAGIAAKVRRRRKSEN